MNRRDFLRGSVVLGGPLAAVGGAAEPKPARRIIDAHCHAGRGLNYGQADAAMWTTFNDPAWLLRQAQEAGIEQSVIFPISNVTYEKANEEIAGYVRQYPEIGRASCREREWS